MTALEGAAECADAGGQRADAGHVEVGGVRSSANDDEKEGRDMKATGSNRSHIHPVPPLKA